MNVTPHQVIESIVKAGVEDWVLMGLYGYVGYLTQPRATQDVDILIGTEEKELAIGAIVASWPMLEMRDQSPVVVRFADLGEAHGAQQSQIVIDIMMPTDPCQLSILRDHVVIDTKTGHRTPTREAALASKYSAIVSPFRDWNRKQQDVVDFRSITLPDHESINRDAAFELAELLFEGAGQELLDFIQLTIDHKPFPV